MTQGRKRKMRLEILFKAFFKHVFKFPSRISRWKNCKIVNTLKSNTLQIQFTAGRIDEVKGGGRIRRSIAVRGGEVDADGELNIELAANVIKEAE